MKNQFLALLAGGSAFLGTGCDHSDRSRAEPDSPEEASRSLALSREAIENAGLSSTAAGPGEISRRAHAFGEIALNTERVHSVPARIDGVIDADHAQLGDRVEAGTVLATIESRSLASAIIAYLSSEHDLHFARSEFERERKLYAKKLTSAEDFHSKEQAHRQAQIAHAAALQPLRLINFEEAELHRHLENPEGADLTLYEVRSPIAGVVTRKDLLRGESVSADRELFVIADLADVWIDFQVPLADAAALRRDQVVQVASGDGAVATEATVRYIAPLVSEQTRTVEARASMPNPEGHWRPGTPVVVRFDCDRESFPVTVPAQAVLDFEGGFAVFVRRGDSTFQLRPVAPGRRDEERVAIASGLEAGEKVVTEGAFQLKAEWAMAAEE